jgi:spore coat polysaccharide biosynthesis predicted glycosyltransferase SpsG
MTSHRDIYIRADGSKDIGMGHLNRAAILSDYLQTTCDSEVLLIINNDYKATQYLSNKNVQFTTLKAIDSVDEELESIDNVFDDLGVPGVLILDILERDINSQYINGLKKYGMPIVAITDDSDKRLIDVDLVLNGNPNQNKHSYDFDSGVYLKGAKYFIMDKGYSKLITEPFNPVISRIFVSVGGSDHNNILFRILETLDRIGQFKIRVVTSESTGYLRELHSSVGNLKNPVELLVDVPNLIESFKGCQVAITAGGNTLFERIASGLAGCTLCQLKRQNEIAESFATQGVNVNLGLDKDITEVELFSSLTKFIYDSSAQREQVLKSRSVVDGSGLEKVSVLIKNLLKKNQDI